MPILSLFIAIVSVIALSPLAGFAQSRQVRSLTKSEGLSDLLVNEIYKDSRGYIWFGSESAVDRFDGNSLMSFELPRNSGIKNRVNAILRVPSGDVLVGSQTGLFVIRQRHRRAAEAAFRQNQLTGKRARLRPYRQCIYSVGSRCLLLSGIQEKPYET